MSVSYEFDDQEQYLTVYVKGHFNFSLVSEFRNIYSKIKSTKKITIDFGHTDVIDSSGLGILLYLQKHYGCQRDQIHLINCNSAITKTFNMAQFKKLFTY